ncbi:MAG TPA: DUF2269 family protein [Capillimicrobium sp.]|nr:DUF2269 family protein [Capillimicrobium sp.]
MSLYELSLFVHITAVVVGFGATFAEAIAAPVALKMDPRHLPYVHRLQIAINRYLASPALIVIVLTGIYQAVDGNWEFGDVWISATFAIVIVLGGLLGGYFIPTDQKLGAMVERDLAGSGSPSEEYQRLARTEGYVGTLTGVLIVVAIFLMVVKPGA